MWQTWCKHESGYNRNKNAPLPLPLSLPLNILFEYDRVCANTNNDSEDLCGSYFFAFVCLFVDLFASDLILQNQITFDLAAKIQIQINVSSYLIFHLVLLLSRNHLVVFSARFGWREWVSVWVTIFFFYMFPLVNWYESAYCSCNMVCLFAVYSRALATPIWNGKIRVSIFSGELEYKTKADFSRI